jgi:hypothetical protein
MNNDGKDLVETSVDAESSVPIASVVATPKRGGRRRRNPDAPPPAKPNRIALTPARVAGRASERARLVAAVILDVLAGQRTPTQAAVELGVVPVRYYQIETRALAGLLSACEPPLRGRQAASQDEQKLKEECGRLRAEAARSGAEIIRLQTLMRTARSAFGYRPPMPIKPSNEATGKRGRIRKPRVRALRLSKLLKKEAEASPKTGDTVTSGPVGG